MWGGDANNVTGPSPPIPLSPDAKLSSLTVTSGLPQPAFSIDVANYSVEVATAVASVAVTAQPQDAGATVSINGQPTTNQSVSLNAAGSSKAIPIEVTAPNGSQKTYTVVMNRATIVLSGNNNLSALVVSAGAFVPVFAATTISYGLTVPNSTADSTGQNSITVVVTAGNGAMNPYAANPSTPFSSRE